MSVGLIHGSILSTDERSYPYIFIKGFVTYNDLSNNGIFTFHVSSMLTSTYRIISITTLAANSTNFLGGDRYIYFGNLNEPRWYLSPQTNALVGNMSFVKESEGLGIIPSLDLLATDDTLPGFDLVIRYYNGTTDYTSGQLFFSITLFQTTV